MYETVAEICGNGPCIVTEIVVSDGTHTTTLEHKWYWPYLEPYTLPNTSGYDVLKYIVTIDDGNDDRHERVIFGANHLGYLVRYVERAAQRALIVKDNTEEVM